MAGILSTPNSRGKIIVTQLLSIFIWLFVLMVCITVVGAGIPILFFFFHMMGNMGEDLEFFKYLTIYSLLPADRLIAESGEALVPCLVLLFFSILLSAIGCVWFTKKDFSL